MTRTSPVLSRTMIFVSTAAVKLEEVMFLKSYDSHDLYHVRKWLLKQKHKKVINFVSSKREKDIFIMVL